MELQKKLQKTDLDLRINRELVVVRNINANVCQQCGEKTLPALNISELYKRVKKELSRHKVKKISVPVVEFARA